MAAAAAAAQRDADWTAVGDAVVSCFSAFLSLSLSLLASPCSPIYRDVDGA